MTLFVSYTKSDDAVVRTIRADLEQLGHNVWMDHQIHGGESWWREIIQEIQGAAVFVFALSKHSWKSRPCRLELDYANALGLPVLPLQVGPLDHMYIPLAERQIIDCRERTADSMVKLVTALTEMVSRRVVLPDPLPAPPPVPFEYLYRIAGVMGPERITPERQEELIGTLRRKLREEDDHLARADIVKLLRELKERNEITVPNAREVDEILAGVTTAPTPADGATRLPPADHWRRAEASSGGAGKSAFVERPASEPGSGGAPTTGAAPGSAGSVPGQGSGVGAGSGQGAGAGAAGYASEQEAGVGSAGYASGQGSGAGAGSASGEGLGGAAGSAPGQGSGGGVGSAGSAAGQAWGGVAGSAGSVSGQAAGAAAGQGPGGVAGSVGRESGQGSSGGTGSAPGQAWGGVAGSAGPIPGQAAGAAPGQDSGGAAGSVGRESGQGAWAGSAGQGSGGGAGSVGSAAGQGSVSGGMPVAGDTSGSGTGTAWGSGESAGAAGESAGSTTGVGPVPGSGGGAAPGMRAGSPSWLESMTARNPEPEAGAGSAAGWPDVGHGSAAGHEAVTRPVARESRTGAGPAAAGHAVGGPAGAGSPGVGPAGGGSAGVGSPGGVPAGAGQASVGSAGGGLAGGSAGSGSTGAGPAGVGSAGAGSAGEGGAPAWLVDLVRADPAVRESVKPRPSSEGGGPAGEGWWTQPLPVTGDNPSLPGQEQSFAVPPVEVERRPRFGPLGAGLGVVGIVFFVVAVVGGGEAGIPLLGIVALLVGVLGLSVGVVAIARQEPGARAAAVVAAVGLAGAILYAALTWS